MKKLTLGAILELVRTSLIFICRIEKFKTNSWFEPIVVFRIYSTPRKWYIYRHVHNHPSPNSISPTFRAHQCHRDFPSNGPAAPSSAPIAPTNPSHQSSSRFSLRNNSAQPPSSPHSPMYPPPTTSAQGAVAVRLRERERRRGVVIRDRSSMARCRFSSMVGRRKMRS
jgi:hypothetical protein